jgi:phage shock protein PspC (stress-responsive transcriptional regulator)
MMYADQTSLIRRDDTFLGVCQAIGEDFGFNPQYLRAAFAIPLLFNPLWALIGYGALAALVVVSRVIVPNPRRKAAKAAAAAAPAPSADNEMEALAVAA